MVAAARLFACLNGLGAALLGVIAWEAARRRSLFGAPVATPWVEDLAWNPSFIWALSGTLAIGTLVALRLRVHGARAVALAALLGVVVGALDFAIENYGGFVRTILF